MELRPRGFSARRYELPEDASDDAVLFAMYHRVFVGE